MDAPPRRRRDADSALSLSRAQAQAVLDAAVDAIITIDRSGIVQSFNRAAETLFGYTAAEMLGRNVSRLMPAEHRARHDDYLHHYLTTGEKKIIGIGRQVEGRRRDGSLFPMELAVSEAVVDGERYFTGLVRDVSERLRTQERLRQREEQLRLTVDYAPLGVVTSGSDRRILDVNPAYCNMLGRGRDELLGNDFGVWTLPDDAARDRALFDDLWQGRLENFSVERRYLHRGGDVVYARLYAAMVHDGAGRPIMAVTIVQDLSEQRRAEAEARTHRERLAHVSRLSTLGEMATGIAHEINQPLTAAATYARACHRLIAGGQADRDELLATLDKISAQAQRAGEVIRRMREFIRKRESRREARDLNELVDDAVKLAETDASKKDFAIVTRLARRPLPVEADPIQIQQVLLNLIRNAMDAMTGFAASNEPVTVSVRTAAEDRNTAHVSVSDRGSGIDAKQAAQLFEPFFTTKTDGMGMGLSISRSIVTSHGGRLWFEPNRDAGVTLHFTLPLLDHPARHERH